MGGYCSVLLGFLSFQSILFLSFFIVLYCGPILLLCWVSACGLQIEALFDKQCLHQHRPQQAAQVPKARVDAQQSRQRRLMLPSFVVADAAVLLLLLLLGDGRLTHFWTNKPSIGW